MPVPYSFKNASGTIPLSQLDDNFAVTALSADLAAPAGASSIGIVPTPTIASTTVADAINELDTEKATVASVALKANSADLAASTGASLIGFQQTGTGSVARTVDAKGKETVSLWDFIPAGTVTATTDCSAYIINAFTYGSTYGIKIIAPAGTYSIASQILWTITKSFHLECDIETVFKPSAAFPVDTNLFKPVSGTTDYKKFVWKNGTIDGRLMPTKINPTLTADLMNVDGTYADLLFDNASFITNDTRTGTAADACLSLVRFHDCNITNCSFTGAVDAAIYVTADPTQTLGKNCTITDNSFYECNVGVVSKRSFKNYIVTNNYFEHCNIGVATGPADTTLLPGTKNIISDNIFNACRYAMYLQKSDYTIVHDNLIEDHGVDSTGASTGNGAIVLWGSSYCSVHHNLVSRPTAPALYGICAVFLRDFVYNSVTYISRFNLIDGNNIFDCNIGIREIESSSDNTITAMNHYYNCVTNLSLVSGYTGVSIEGTNPNIIFTKEDSGVDEKLWRINQTANALQLTSRNDDGSAGGVVWGATRTGGLITELRLGSNYGSLILADTGTTLTDSNGITLTGNSQISAGKLELNGALAGSTTIYSVLAKQVVQSSVTVAAYNFASQFSTQAASFTLGSFTHFSAAQQTFTGGSAVTTQIGFSASSGLTGATTNYGFYGNIAASGTARYNLFMGGTAPNYFAGNTYTASGTTTMTDGFFYIPTAAGAPTGVPTAISGRVPMYYDSTNNRFYVYNGAWKSVVLA
jgi:hypothetical protein